MSKSEFRDFDHYRSAIPNFPHLFFRTFDKPKVYDYIPETFKMKWEDPHKFIPDRMLSHFNQRTFINYIHRECFNSCVNTNAALSEAEKSCYENCKNKHLSALGTFKEALLQNRKWKGWKNFINLREYERTPEEIGTVYPTDPHRRADLETKKELKFMSDQSRGLREALNSEFESPVEESTVFDEYLKGKYPAESLVGKHKASQQRKDVYNEYKELNEKYGAQVAELLRSKVNMKDWKDIPGDDWLPDEESPAVESAPEGKSEEAPDSSNDS